MNLEEETTAVRFKRAVHGAGWATGIGARREILAAPALGVVADRQVALDQIHLFPILVHEGFGRVDSGLKAQQPRAAAALLRFVERAGEDLLLDAGRIAGRRLPAAAHVEAVEFEMRFVDGPRRVLLPPSL